MGANRGGEESMNDNKISVTTGKSIPKNTVLNKLSQ